jgi:4-hydroxybenzoate polyprenyltransferase
MISDLIRLSRPRHWVKNVFVVMPLPFAVAAGAELHVGSFLLGLFGFCLVNSAVYVGNDIVDAEADRHHSRKRHRLIASGVVRPGVAAVFGATLLACGLGMCAATGSESATCVALAYVAINVVYTGGAKHIAVLDVFLIASGFVLRVYLGCFLVEAMPSDWLLLCSSGLALFLGFAKRRSDLNGETGTEHRPSLEGYSQAFLDQAMAVSAAVALVSYALYTVNSEVLRDGRQLASLPFVAYGIFSYLRLVEVDGAGHSPVDIAFRSRSLQICALGWVLSVLWSLK